MVRWVQIEREGTSKRDMDQEALEQKSKEILAEIKEGSWTHSVCLLA
jgi:hypothetical protein